MKKDIRQRIMHPERNSKLRKFTPDTYHDQCAMVAETVNLIDLIENL